MTSSSRLYFDEFELRLDSGELLREGSLVATLQPQPARVLGLLAGRAGEVVSREEIQRLVWGETFVDFDAGLNFSIKQIRRALGDSATDPRYLETLPRRGYRFLRPVRTEEAEAEVGASTLPEPEAAPAGPLPEPAPEAARTRASRPASRSVPWSRFAGVAVALAGLVLAGALAARRSASLQTPRPHVAYRPAGAPEPSPATPAPAGSRLPPEAAKAYQRGVYLAAQWKFPEAEKSFEEAVLLAPRFARAYAGLANARVQQGVDPDSVAASRAAAERALRLDPRLPEAHLAMANVLFMDRLDLPGAGAEFRQALALDPDSVDVLHAHATYLAALGRLDEAVAQIDRAIALDPASMMIRADRAWYLYLARRYDESIREARSTLALLATAQGTPSATAGYGEFWSKYALVYSSLKKGDDVTVLATLKERMRKAGRGDVAAKVRTVPEILEWRRRLNTPILEAKPGTSYELASLNALAGHRDEALDYLEQACRNGGEGLMFNFVAVEPVFDSLHGDPRFAKIVDCVGLPGDAPVLRPLRAEAGAR